MLDRRCARASESVAATARVLCSALTLFVTRVTCARLQGDSLLCTRFFQELSRALKAGTPGTVFNRDVFMWCAPKVRRRYPRSSCTAVCVVHVAAAL